MRLASRADRVGAVGWQQTDFSEVLILAIFGWRLLSTRYCEPAGSSETLKLVMSFDRSIDFRHMQANDWYGSKTLETLQKPWMVLDSGVLRKTNEN